MLYYLMIKNPRSLRGCSLAPRFKSLAALADGLAALDLCSAQELKSAGLEVVTVKPGQPRPQPVALS